VTSNYNKVKNKEDKLAKASQVRKNTGAVKSENVLVGNTSHISGVSGKVRAGENGKTNVRTNGAVVKRRNVQTKPEEINTRLPKWLGWLGFDAKERFETIAISTANRHPIVLYIAITVLITAMFMTLVINAVGINKLKTETTQMNSHLATLIEREAELSLELEKRDDLRYIREVAINVHGMMDKKYANKHYISLEKDPKVELSNKAEDQVDVVIE
jgi:hypothetical protein